MGSAAWFLNNLSEPGAPSPTPEPPARLGQDFASRVMGVIIGSYAPFKFSLKTRRFIYQKPEFFIKRRHNVKQFAYSLNRKQSAYSLNREEFGSYYNYDAQQKYKFKFNVNSGLDKSRIKQRPIALAVILQKKLGYKKVFNYEFYINEFALKPEIKKERVEMENMMIHIPKANKKVIKLIDFKKEKPEKEKGFDLEEFLAYVPNMKKKSYKLL